MSVHNLVAAALLCLLSPAVFRIATAAPTPSVTCPPCGAWTLDWGGNADAAVDAALSRYEPPHPKRGFVPYGDIAAETEHEFQSSLDRPPPGHRDELRNNLLALTRAPDSLVLKLEGTAVVIEASPGGTRRVHPGEPHSRVDSLGTARINSRWRKGGLVVTESYDRRTSNSVTYAVDAARGRLTVTRVIQRRGLPDLTVRAEYVPASP